MLPQSAPSLERQASFNTTHGAADTQDKHAYCPVCHRRFINVRTRNSHIGIPKCINSARIQGFDIPPDLQSLRGPERHAHLKESWAKRYLDEMDRSQTPAQGPVAARSSGGTFSPAPVAPTNGSFPPASFDGGITSMNSVPPVGSQYNFHPSRPSASQHGMNPHLPRPAHTPAQHWSMNAAAAQSRPFSIPSSGLASTGNANGPHLSQAPFHAARLPAPTALQRSATYTPSQLQFPAANPHQAPVHAARLPPGPAPTALQRSATYTPSQLQFPPANPQTNPAGPSQRTSWIHPQQTAGRPAQLQQSASFGGHGSVHPGQGTRTAPSGPAFSPPQPAQAGSLANVHAVRNSGAVSQAYLQQMYQSLGTPPLAQVTPPQQMGRPQQLNGPAVSPMGSQSPLSAQLNAATATQIGPRFGGPSQSSYLSTPSARGDTTGTLSENVHLPAPPLPPPATQPSAPNQTSRPPQMHPSAFQSPYPPGGAAHFRVEDGSNGGVATQVGRPQSTHPAWPMQASGGTALVRPQKPHSASSTPLMQPQSAPPASELAPSASAQHAAVAANLGLRHYTPAQPGGTLVGVSSQSSAMDVDEEQPQVAGSMDAAVAGDSAPASFETQSQSPPEQRAGGIPLDDDVEDVLAFLDTQFTRVKDTIAALPKEEQEDEKRSLKSMVDNVLLDLCVAPETENEDEATPESGAGLPQTPPDEFPELTFHDFTFLEQCSKDEMMMEYLFGPDEEDKAEQEIPQLPWFAYYEGGAAYLPPCWTQNP
ncbi:hypothetical protein GGX14DRAFT_602000 [Mycena pura]|uniref:Uncharacterized protein n=1 Tax=Mycena pura TaxID=153505 RepID=A0AAD6VN40_9AGAR|nr:hypothetical protein GGX14DRAFT_602000 [Mycena pura]